MIQFIMGLCGLVALYLTTKPHSSRWRRWAPVVGLIGQPAWLVFAWSTQGWGLLVLSVVYTGVYARDAWNHWR